MTKEEQLELYINSLEGEKRYDINHCGKDLVAWGDYLRVSNDFIWIENKGEIVLTLSKNGSFIIKITEKDQIRKETIAKWDAQARIAEQQVKWIEEWEKETILEKAFKYLFWISIFILVISSFYYIKNNI